jgi:PAS domain S-box-containing protein
VFIKTEICKFVKKHSDNLLNIDSEFLAIADNLSDAIISTNESGRIIYANKATERIFGFRRNELVGDYLTKLIPVYLREKHSVSFLSYLKSGQKNRSWNDIELTALRSNGDEFPVEISIAEFNKDGSRIFAGVIWDIGHRKQAEEKMKRYQEKLEEINRRLSRYDYAVSHDLKEPLRVISGFARLIQKREPDNKEINEYTEFIRSSAERMQNLLSDLLKFSQLTSKELPLEKVDCNEVMKTVCSNLSMMIQETGASINYDGLPSVTAAPAHILQLFQNLVGNALKFRSSSPPEIRISWEGMDSMLKFAVSDNGIGIAPEFHEKIFGVFQRLHSYDEYPGTGVGLTLCKDIVEMYGGKIWVESEAGKGTRFYFTLPAG